MKTQELRIGNLVTIDNPKYHPAMKDVPMVVTSISLRSNFDEPGSEYAISLDQLNPKNRYAESFSQFERFIKPIPLTEEWAMRNGFDKGKSWYPHMILPNEFTKLIFDENKKSIQIANTCGTQSGNFKCEYIHQFQNLYFALTGIELPIKTE